MRSISFQDAERIISCLAMPNISFFPAISEHIGHLGTISADMKLASTIYFWIFYDIITLIRYRIDKQEFVEQIATASCLSTPTACDII